MDCRSSEHNTCTLGKSKPLGWGWRKSGYLAITVEKIFSRICHDGKQSSTLQMGLSLLFLKSLLISKLCQMTCSSLQLHCLQQLKLAQELCKWNWLISKLTWELTWNLKLTWGNVTYWNLINCFHHFCIQTCDSLLESTLHNLAALTFANNCFPGWST